MSTDRYSLKELNLESTLGAVGQETDQRTVPVIDLSDFDQRKNEIADQLWLAASDIGFLQLKNHGISTTRMDQAFALAQAFFELPETTKARYPLVGHSNAGWESKTQIRPSTGTRDQKESYQITRPRMTDLWPSATELPQFKTFMLDFEQQCWQLGMKILSCFALKLGFKEDFFTLAHAPDQADFQSTLRLLHYYPVTAIDGADHWRAGAHTDFDCLTMVFQREGQGGLQLCPGKEADSNHWTSVTPANDVITCNIGDMLMRWSDDVLKSTLHRVRMPKPEEHQGSRYSLAYFCQANRHVMIQGPARKYTPISAGEYLKQRIQANFAGGQTR